MNKTTLSFLLPYAFNLPLAVANSGSLIDLSLTKLDAMVVSGSITEK
jgi:hypothetical protein